jgi:Mn2+/Fe2+ NRAMP family transporter
VFGIKHSLHRTWRDARAFHASFAAIIALAAAVVLLPALPLGTVTTLVQAFAGILLPCTLVLLLILCNDKQLSARSPMDAGSTPQPSSLSPSCWRSPHCSRSPPCSTT